MPKPTKDPTIQQKIKGWIEKNMERTYTAKYKDIAVEADVSLSSMYRYFPIVAARVMNVLPSVILQKRQEAGGMSSLHAKLTDDEIAEIQHLFAEGTKPIDIAFITGRSLSKVEQYRPKGEADENA